MKICFVLPFSGHNPVGGFKVVYEYANGFARKGHEVTVVHAPLGLLGETSLAQLAKRFMIFVGRAVGLKGGVRPQKWFIMDSRVDMRWVPSLHSKWIPSADVVFATAWLTAEWVSMYPENKGRKFYLIQHQESVLEGTYDTRVMATWKLPLQKVVIARWLEDIAKSLGESAYYVPNGLDFNAFGLDIPVEERDPCKLIMLYHDQAWKGSRDGVEAMSMVRKKVTGLKATLFGVPPRPEWLPAWIDYVQKPSQAYLRRLYNEAAIFVSPSWAEGWPLPPAEAAQCGSALCITDIGGHHEYALPNETALLSSPRNSDALAQNILRLILDNDLRIRLALYSNQYIQRFTWKRAVTTLEKHLLEFQ